MTYNTVGRADGNRKQRGSRSLTAKHVGRQIFQRVLVMSDPIRSSRNRGVFWGAAVAAILAIALAGASMTLLFYRYPILATQPIVLGVFVFSLIMLLDLFAIFRLIVLDYGVGEGRVAVKLAGSFLLWGFLVASVMGLLASLAIAKPWVTLPLLFTITVCINIYTRRAKGRV